MAFTQFQFRPDATLVFSYVGMEKAERKVSGNINIGA